MVPILQKEGLKRRILERLVYSVCKDVEHAVARDGCVALTLAIRDRLVDNWVETTRLSLYARTVCKTHQRSKLERLCRYITRPPA